MWVSISKTMWPDPPQVSGLTYILDFYPSPEICRVAWPIFGSWSKGEEEEYVCMYVCMYVSMYVSMYLCMHMLDWAMSKAWTKLLNNVVFMTTKHFTCCRVFQWCPLILNEFSVWEYSIITVIILPCLFKNAYIYVCMHCHLVGLNLFLFGRESLFSFYSFFIVCLDGFSIW